MPFITQSTGEKAASPGTYRSTCCSREENLAQRAALPACPQCGQACEWELSRKEISDRAKRMIELTRLAKGKPYEKD